MQGLKQKTEDGLSMIVAKTKELLEESKNENEEEGEGEGEAEPQGE